MAALKHCRAAAGAGRAVAPGRLACACVPRASLQQPQCCSPSASTSAGGGLDQSASLTLQRRAVLGALVAAAAAAVLPPRPALADEEGVAGEQPVDSVVAEGPPVAIEPIGDAVSEAPAVVDDVPAPGVTSSSERRVRCLEPGRLGREGLPETAPKGRPALAVVRLLMRGSWLHATHHQPICMSCASCMCPRCVL